MPGMFPKDTTVWCENKNATQLDMKNNVRGTDVPRWTVVGNGRQKRVKKKNNIVELRLQDSTSGQLYIRKYI